MSAVTYKTICVEVELNFDPAGLAPTQLDFRRIVFWQNPPIPPDPGFDLSPSGVALNYGPSGLAAGGNLLVTDTENQVVHAYDFETGARIPWPQTPPVPPTDPLWAGWSVNPNADEPEDIVYVPTRDQFYIVQEDESGTYGGYRIAVFQPDGTFVSSFPVDGSPGGPKGLAYLEDTATFPCAIRAAGGTVVLSWDNEGPGLEGFNLDGTSLMFEPLPSAPPLDPGNQALAIESLSVDPASGRFFLVQQGDVTDDNYLYILTPVWGDLDGDGVVTPFDLAMLYGCVSGPDLVLAPACLPVDGDCDTDADLADVALFQSRYRPS
jgi:hypothetical protein